MWNGLTDYEKDRYRRRDRRQREEEKLRQAIELTKGIRNHFWLENQFINKEGQRQELTDEKRDELLQNVTKITNLGQLETEWPFVDWFEIVKSQITFEVLRPHLNKFSLPKSLILE